MQDKHVFQEFTLGSMVSFYAHRKRFVLHSFVWVVTMSLFLSGCNLYEQAKSMIWGPSETTSIADRPRQTPRKPAVDPVLEKKKKTAIQRVQKTVTHGSWTVTKEIERYRRIAEKIAKRKQLPKPTGFDWSALCSKGGTCKVTMEFWDGRQPLQAMWLVSDQVSPLNCWAHSFMAQVKKAQECFIRVAKQLKQKSEHLKKKAAGGDIWVSSDKKKDTKKPEKSKKAVEPVISPRSAARR